MTRLTQVSDQRALDAILSEAARYLMLGEECLNPIYFYHWADPKTGTEIGLRCNFPMPETASIGNRLAAFGFDLSVVIVDLQSAEIYANIPLPAPFYNFLPDSSCGRMVVVFEIGVLALNEQGYIVWRRDLGDIITGAKTEGSEVLVQTFEAGEFRLELAHGLPLGGTTSDN